MGHPPPLSASRFPCHGARHGACHGTGRCTDPNRGSGAGWKTTYDRAAGILAGLSAGYRFGGRLRVEAEWFHRESAYDQTSPVTSATGDTFAKLDGEIQRAEDRRDDTDEADMVGQHRVDRAYRPVAPALPFEWPS